MSRFIFKCLTVWLTALWLLVPAYADQGEAELSAGWLR